LTLLLKYFKVQYKNFTIIHMEKINKLKITFDDNKFGHEILIQICFIFYFY